MKNENTRLDSLANAFYRKLYRSGFSKNSAICYATDVVKFITFLNSQGVSDIRDLSQTHIQNYFEQLCSTKKVSTIRRNISSIKRFLMFVREKTGLDFLNALARIRVSDSQKTTRKLISIKELETVLSSLKGTDFLAARDRVIVMTLYFTGMKVSEMCELKVSDIKLDKGLIEVSGKKKRSIEMAEELRDAFRTYLKERTLLNIRKGRANGKWLFVDRAGRRLTRQSIFLVVRKCCKNAGIDRKVSPQTLRNSVAMHLLLHGASCSALMEMLGNKFSLPEVLLEGCESKDYPFMHPVLRDK